MMLKRLFDLLFSTVALLLLLPLFLLIALWIKVGSPGPIFFKQVRVGRGGKNFCIYKFRTMHADSEQLGLQLTVASDERVTRQGAFLRKHKLDELPQLLNVYLGQMSIVGPRPEVPKYIDMYPKVVRDIVLSVRPGMTDLASIEFKDENHLLDCSNDPEATYIEKILPIKQQYYMDYVAQNSLCLDIKIILKTINKIIAG